MRNWDKFQEELGNCPGYIPFITDGDLAVVLGSLEAGFLRSNLRTPLLAEIWVRRWLYTGKFVTPREFTAAFGRFSPDFETAFTKLASSWRRPRIEGNPLPP